jgi:hypothetical protein
MIMKKLIILLLFVLPIKMLAQTSITGRVLDFENKLPLAQVTIQNQNNKQTTKTAASGQFSLRASQGDVLTFSLNGYHTDTLYLTSLRPLAVYLPNSSISLNEVRIQSANVSPYLDVENINAGIKPTRRVEGDDLAGKKNNDRAGGVILNLGFDKMKDQREKEQRLTANEGYENEIRLNFNETTVGNLVKLKGQELKDFITIYQPSVERVRDEAPFNYTLYIAQAYQAWLKLPPAQRKVPKFK